MIGGPTSEARTMTLTTIMPKHGEAIALEAPPRVLPERRSDDVFVGVQYRTRGSMKPYAISTSKLKNSTTIEMNATMPMMSGSSRFRFALMK